MKLKKKNGKRIEERIIILMKETFPIRRQWIVQDTPPVKVVLQEFPCLQVFQNVCIATLYILCT